MIRLRFLTALLAVGLGALPAASASAAPPLTLQKAEELHKLMAGQPDIVFDYVRDGCYARAQLMIRKMESLGIRAGKVWAFPPSPGEQLQVATPHAPGGKVKWTYHVAPVVHVRNGKQDVEMVIDPSLFHHPVTIAEWARSMKTPAGRAPVLSRTAYGEPPLLPDGNRAAGSYTPASNPPNPDISALQTMLRYKGKKN